ncbi:MAG: serine/threonine protein kinase [Xylophilus ampelinus]
MPSGIPGFDEVLDGGFIEGSLYLIEGRAGAGKTILSNQIAFHHARAGARVLYVTLIAESHVKLLNHLTALSFYDETLVAEQVHYLSAYGQLKEGGLRGFFEAVAGAMLSHRPQLLFIDGFRSASEFSASPLELSQFIHELSTLVSSLRTTCFLLAPLSGNEPHPEHTLVDGLIELNNYSDGMRRTREIEVHKLRAADHMVGRHMFAISSDGIRVYPRLESVASRRIVEPRLFDEQQFFGIAGLDRVLHGGIARGSTTSLVGAPGSGKTLTGLSFLAEGLRRGEAAVYLGFYESPDRLIAKMRRVGVDLQPFVDAGQLRILWQPALEFTVDLLVHKLFEALQSTDARRVFLDGVEGFKESSIHPERMVLFFTALADRLRGCGVSALCTEEVPLFSARPGMALRHVSAVFENILWLRHALIDGTNRRLLSVLKMRDSDYDSAIQELRIDSEGLHVGPLVTPISGVETLALAPGVTQAHQP